MQTIEHRVQVRSGEGKIEDVTLDQSILEGYTEFFSHGCDSFGQLGHA